MNYGMFNSFYYDTQIIALILHMLRISIYIAILISEILLCVPRVILGTLLTPIGFKIGVGQLYALPCAFRDGFLS